MKDINSLEHTKWRCQYHVIFSPKYRRQVIYREIRADVGYILRRFCEQKGVEIIEANACPDHIHMLISIPPKYCFEVHAMNNIPIVIGGGAKESKPSIIIGGVEKKIYDGHIIIGGVAKEFYKSGAVVTDITYYWNDGNGGYQYQGQGSPVTINSNGVHIEFPWKFYGSGSSAEYDSYNIVFKIPLGKSFNFEKDQVAFSVDPFVAGTCTKVRPDITLWFNSNLIPFSFALESSNISSKGGTSNPYSSAVTDTFFLHLEMEWNCPHTITYECNISLDIPNEAIHILPNSENIPIIFS